MAEVIDFTIGHLRPRRQHAIEQFAAETQPFHIVRLPKGGPVTFVKDAE